MSPGRSARMSDCRVVALVMTVPRTSLDSIKSTRFQGNGHAISVRASQVSACGLHPCLQSQVQGIIGQAGEMRSTVRPYREPRSATLILHSPSPYREEYNG